jgi:hypothetical protein
VGLRTQNTKRNRKHKGKGNYSTPDVGGKGLKNIKSRYRYRCIPNDVLKEADIYWAYNNVKECFNNGGKLHVKWYRMVCYISI